MVVQPQGKHLEVKLFLKDLVLNCCLLANYIDKYHIKLLKINLNTIEIILKNYLKVLL